MLVKRKKKKKEKKKKTIAIPLLPYFLSPIMIRSCPTLFLLFVYFVAIAFLMIRSCQALFLLFMYFIDCLISPHGLATFPAGDINVIDIDIDCVLECLSMYMYVSGILALQ